MRDSIPSRRRPLGATLALLAALACASPHAPVLPERVHGTISLPFLSSLPLGMTGVPHAGVATTVFVRTYGSSSCDRPAGLDVVTGAAAVTLTPWVTARTPASICTEDLRAWEHQATVVFPTAGPARISAYGVIQEAAGGSRLGTVSIDVTVLP